MLNAGKAEESATLSLSDSRLSLYKGFVLRLYSDLAKMVARSANPQVIIMHRKFTQLRAKGAGCDWPVVNV